MAAGEGWDKGVHYDYAYGRLVSLVRKAEYPASCYAAVLLVQLVNATRVSEAVRAFREFLKRDASEVRVQVSKRRKPVKRLVVKPAEVDAVRALCADLADVDEGRLINRVKVFAVRRLGINTHSLRYAGVTRLLRLGLTPPEVAKITGHATLDEVLTYTQRVTAEEVLRRAARWR